MIFARSAAMAFNRLIDHDIDSQNERTAMREIPTGILSKGSVGLFVAINCALFMLCTWLINEICFYLSPIALTVILGYSYTKRFTALSHFILGLGLSLSPIGAYLAVASEFNILPILFSIAVLLWVSGFDIIYALQDEAFDKAHKLFSVPAWLGRRKALTLSKALHLLTAGVLVSAGISAGFGMWYWIGTLIFTGMLAYQHSLVKPDDLSKVNLAFFTTNGFASILFSICVLIALFNH